MLIIFNFQWSALFRVLFNQEEHFLKQSLFSTYEGMNGGPVKGWTQASAQNDIPRFDVS